MLDHTFKISKYEDGPEEVFTVSLPTTTGEWLELGYDDEKVAAGFRGSYVIALASHVRSVWKAENGSVAKAKKVVEEGWFWKAKARGDALGTALAKAAERTGLSEVEILEARLEAMKGEGA